jgi:Rrf2 family transcriptional regulator, nitric oxide-sensitive transcriptional repressor
MKLQKASSFALYAVIELAANPTHQLSGTEIAEKYGISAHHLAKVLRDLGRAGIVDAARGVGGGYRLVVNPKRLTLLDVIQIFEPVGPQGASSADPELATDAGYALRVVLDELDDHTLATFRSITISTMLKLMARKPWTNAVRAPKATRRAASNR